MPSQYSTWLTLTRYTTLPMACLLGIVNVSATFGPSAEDLPQLASLLAQVSESEPISKDQIIIEYPEAEELSAEEIDSISTEIENEVLVLIAEVEIVSETGELSEELSKIAYEAIRTRPGTTIPESILQEDIEAIFETGFFYDASFITEATEAGVKVTFLAEPNPVLTNVIVEGRQVLPQEVVSNIFASQYGQVLNLVDFQNSIDELNNWYQENGYVLAQVIAEPKVTEDGVVVIQVAEGVIEDINIQFVDEAGNPVQGKTREFVILREFQTQPGDVFQQRQVQADLQGVFGTGVFNDADLILDPGDRDPRKVDFTIIVQERVTGTFAYGVGFNFSGDAFISVTFDEVNFRNVAQNFTTEIQLSETQLIVSSSIDSLGHIKYEEISDSISFLKSNSSLFSELLQRELLRSNRELLRSNQDDEVGNLSDDVLKAFYGSGRTEDILQELISNSESLQPPAFELLNLINLGNTHIGNGNYAEALEIYQQSLYLTQELNSSGMELFAWLQIAKTNRFLGNTRGALSGYQNAVEVIKRLRSAEDFEQLFGEEVYDALLADWQLSRKESFDIFKDALALIELTIFLDLSAVYSSLGDYQQANYTLNASSLNEIINQLEAVTPSQLKAFLNLVSTSVSGREQTTDTELDKLIAQVAPKIEEFFGGLAQVSLNSAEDFVDTDLNEASLVVTNHEVSRIAKENISNYIPNFISNTLNPLTEYSETRFPEYSNSINSFLSLVESLFNPKQIELSNEENLRLINNVFDGIVLLLKEKISEENFSADDIENYRLPLKTLLAIFQVSSLQGLSDETDSSELVELILEEWKLEGSSLEQWEWLRGALLKIKADYSYASENYSSAIEIYEESEYLLDQASESIDDIADDFVRLVETSSGKSSIREEKENEFVAQIFSNPAKRWVRTQLINIALKKGDLYIKDSRLLLARDTYNEALRFAINSNNEIEERSSEYEAYLQGFSLNETISTAQILYDFFLKKNQISEIYQKLGAAEQALGAYEEAKAAYGNAIDLVEDSFVDSPASSISSFTSLGYSYGYGIPNLGRLSIGFNLSADNPWSQVQQPQDTALPCETLAEYFACRQKYFESYINTLHEQHRNNPEAGFDVEAFEQNERARTQVSAIFETDEEDAAESERKQLLNETATLANIQQELDGETLLLEFFLGEEESYLWVISNNEPLQMIELPPRDEIEETARAFYDLLTEPSGRVRPETTAQAGDALSRLLFAEVKDEINAHERLVIVGDGFLQYLPFAVLPNPVPESSPSPAAMRGEFGPHLNPLLLEHEVILLPSASALVAIRADQPNRTEPEHELAMFANPVFSHKNSEAPGIALAEGFELTPNAELDDVEMLYSELPTTAEQLADVEPLIPPSDRIQYLKHDADLEAALSPELGDYRIVHFATHGIFNSRAPERSGIVLSAISEEGILQPGLLSPTYAFNEMNLDSTELVVLSGCRTGLSNSDVTREGLTGLTGGLFAAGADRVVASLWSVQDTATQELMGRFYERMLDPEINMTPAEALRDAQISMWNEPQWQTPYYWAAFTLQGEWQGWN